MDSEETFGKVDSLLSKYKIPLAVSLIGLVLLIGGVVSSGIISKTFLKQTKYPPQASEQFPKESIIDQKNTVKVDVSGAVAAPGVYSLSPISRVEEAIKAAGGVVGEADQEYVSKSLNLAQKISDGMKIYVPFKGESVAGVSAASGPGGIGASLSASGNTSIINVNSASLEELDKLPGVGPVTAQKIIDGRPFASIEELYTKKAVTRSVYEKIKGMVSTY